MRVPYTQRHEAKQVGILYHFTRLPSLPALLEQGLRDIGGWGGVSFTRNKRLPQVSDQFKPQSVRLVINGDKLSSKYSIEPFAASGYGRNTGRSEAEMRIRKPVVDVRSSIIQIDVLKSTWEAYVVQPSTSAVGKVIADIQQFSTSHSIPLQIVSNW